MAPSNEYLNNEGNRTRLSAQHGQLVKGSSEWFPGEEPTVHWDFNRPVELGLLKACLDRYTTPDFADGKVTVALAAEGVYGYTDPYLLTRMRGHLSIGRGEFNTDRYTDGVAFYVSDDDVILRDGRDDLSLRWLQEQADKRRMAVREKAGREARGVARETKRAAKMAPAKVAELAAIAQHWGQQVPGQVEGRARRELGPLADSPLLDGEA